MNITHLFTENNGNSVFCGHKTTVATQGEDKDEDKHFLQRTSK